MALSEDHNFTIHFVFLSHLCTYQAETHKSELFKAKNIFSKQLVNSSKQLSKSQENGFFEPKNCQNDPL